MPPDGNLLLAYGYVKLLGDDRGVNITENGLYRRVTLTKGEVGDVIKWMHSSAKIDGILTRFKAKMTIESAHAYYSIAREGEQGKPEEEKTLGWHSDAVAAVLIQVYGAKDLEIGGIHLTPVGSPGETVPLEKLPAGAFVQKQRLEPNSLVGLGARQIHRLYPCSDPNLTLAIKISEL
jgi:hypothetical protein